MKLDRLFRYLYGTVDFGIKFVGGCKIELTAWADCVYMCHEDSKSITGGVTIMCGGVAASMLQRQKLVTKTTAEGELVASASVFGMLLACRQFRSFQGYGLNAYTMYQDNKSTVDMIRTGKPTNKLSKHIQMRY